MGFYQDDFPKRVDLYIKQGVDYSEAILWSPGGTAFDFTGCSAQLKLGSTYGGPTQLLISTTPNAYGSIVLSLGQILVNITRNAPAAAFAPNAVYELWVVDSLGNKTCFMSGYVRIDLSLQ